ncbi:hypothetical protein RchiOBHm_Chr7g0205461 [Rosa chinensis]|uniref:Uncharacterized protein n=1 Tax=Rosa chinensis TaxID=74649 RepID=A0A2P6P8Y5_ROSCH|nr:hypothetical protein RchiOBHm_Chr7g0205461 [Rosa chinensis]
MSCSRNLLALKSHLCVCETVNILSIHQFYIGASLFLCVNISSIHQREYLINTSVCEYLINPSVCEYLISAALWMYNMCGSLNLI